MSSAQGFPDWQRITQWLGPPIVTETGRVIGAGTITDGPYQVSNFASVIVALKAIGGAVTVTIKQTVPAGPASLILTSSVVVPAGATIFEAFVLYGGAVELDLTGAIAGTSVDYALYGSNTTTNAQVITAATINVQHNDVLIAAEPTLDFEDALGFVWAIADDAPNTRVKVTPPASLEHGLATVAPIIAQNTVLETTLATVVFPAGVISPTGLAELDLIGLFQNNTGVNQNLPRFRVFVNGLLKIDTGAIGAGGGVATSGGFFPYKLHLDMIGLSAAQQALGLFMKGASGGSGNLGALSLVGNGSWSTVGMGWEAEILDPNIGQPGGAAITVQVTVINSVASLNYLTSVSGGGAKYASV